MQTCEQGSTDWDQVQKSGESEPEHPAPSIVLTAASAASGDDDATTATASDTTTTAAQPDLVGRFLGLGGLVVGAVGLVVAVAATRRRDASK